jgi:DNA repair protein RadA/Sms
VVRAVKNRFGAANELGVFEMTAGGLEPVANPSALFLAERPAEVAGSAVLCTVEGSRPMLVEVQALVSTSTYGYAKRTANGLDANRLALLLAVLEKRAGLNLAGEDVFVNVAGGMSVDEPAADVALVAALASSVRNRPIRRGLAAFGEIGLGGEVRRATQAGLRIREAVRMGFTAVLAPVGSVADADMPDGCTLVGVRTLGELLDSLFE